MKRFDKLGQGGLVLPVTLILLLLTTVVTLTLLRVAQAEQRLAGNLQERLQARLLAGSLLDQLLATESAFALDLAPDETRCQPGGDCGRDDLALTIPEGVLPVGIEATWQVRRLAPAWLEGWPMRQRESRVSAMDPGRVALFEASVVVDASARRGGRSRLAQGLALRAEGAP